MVMEYKGYSDKIEFDEGANIFHREVIHLRDVVTFEGETVDQLRQAFQDSVDDYLDFCAERGEDPEKPYSGKFVVRVAPELHKRLAIEARKRGISINTQFEKPLVTMQPVLELRMVSPKLLAGGGAVFCSVLPE